MKTGEGKTRVATLRSISRRSPQGRACSHLNDYLAQRDCGHDAHLRLPRHDHRRHRPRSLRRTAPHAYACDVTYATNNELGFDYLRDNMKYERSQMVQARPLLRHRRRGRLDPGGRGAHPLIISGPSTTAPISTTPSMSSFRACRRKTMKSTRSQRSANFSEEGTEKLEKHAARGRPAEGRVALDIENVAIVHHVNNALQGPKALHPRQGLHRTQRRDRHHRRVYRPHDARPPATPKASTRRSKPRKGADPAPKNQTLASITFQELFPHVRQACG